ncbi:DUF6602 domain-containing protein [Pectobacterium brasiliense]|uniref:DUF6602 domain-containing protein n=1 Tax=Pectobacterium brasiliense TaxID=180957 RepID=UPI0005833BD4|nr:DUF6602 domain-containing protein [Pectobacterium brasiliense]KHS77801.1 hypothetical protein RC81_16055 [Pectobacterium brasiliense]
MDQNIIKKILNHKAKRFKSVFAEDAIDLYFNSKNKTFHAAEFGRFRENVTADFLRAFIPGHIGISNGFIVSPTNKISTQCDIILYDKELTPLIQDDNHNQFFPTDCIKGIGEVKSNLTKAALLEALIKLSKIKEISYEISKESTGYNNTEYNREHFSNHAYTFLFCNEIEGNTSGLANEIDAHYNANNVEHKFRHSFILSMDGKACFYTDPTIHRCSFPVTINNQQVNISTPFNINDDFDEAVKAFAQITYVTLSMQGRMIINLMEYIK